MPKFKVGDIVAAISMPTFIYKVIKVDVLNNLYETEVISVHPSSKGGFYGALPTQTFTDPVSLYDLSYDFYFQYGSGNNSIAKNTSPKFKTGDRITLRTDRDFVIGIAFVDTINNEYGLYYHDVPQDKLHLKGKIINYSWYVTEADCELITPNSGINIPATKAIINNVKTCTCSSQDLFNKGCKCGAVKPFKLKMS